jgi:hypothetical protein
MGYWLFNLILRILAGEPYRKATPRELRFYSTIFALIPSLISLICLFPRAFSYIFKLSTIGLYVFWFVCIGIGMASLFAWVKFIPAVVNWALAALAWIGVIWLTLSGKTPWA